MSEMESTKSPTDIFCKYLLIKQDKEKGEFLCSVIFFCPPKKFLVNEGNLRTFIQKAKYIKKKNNNKMLSNLCAREFVAGVMCRFGCLSGFIM